MRLSLSSIFCCLSVLGGATAAVSAADEGLAFFEEKIRPVLAEHCYECHSSTAKKVKGGLLLDTKAGWEQGGDSGKPAIVPGKPDESPLIQSVRHTSDDLKMPAKKPKLPEAVIEDLVSWVKMGAPDPRDGKPEVARRGDKTWWSLQPVSHAAPPAVDGAPAVWRKSAIDRFVWAKLAASGLPPNPPADARTLIRRMSYDVIGLPPTPEEVEAFIAEYARDPDGSTERLADRLLASPHYGEQWGRHWLDVIRFGESTGYERNVIIDNLWPFRDYVIRAFNADKPFNRFIVEQLAGDVIAPDDPEVSVASAFLVSGPYDNVGNQDKVATANIRAVTLDDPITTTASAFLGLTVNCARCHHHKFDPIPTEDYYRLRAAFEGVTHGERVVAAPSAREQYAAATRPLLERRQRLQTEKAALEKSTEEAAKQRLAANAAERQDVERKLAAIPPLPVVWAGNFSQPREHTFVHKGGDPMKPLDAVQPASLSVVDAKICAPFELPLDAPEGQRRRALGEWLAADTQPLTPRVIVNRLWHYHFGTGIVDTPGDFGFLGGLPSHPELLDWLAMRLVQNGWRLKPLQREILLSQTYRQSTAFRAEAARVDKDARLLWRFPPRRLSAEEVRDTVLAVAGKLDPRMGGPGFRLYQFSMDNVCTYTPLDHAGPETYRRAVYHQNARASVVDVLADFDFPDTAFAAPRRANTTTPFQALTLLNHSFTLDMAVALAARVQSEADEPRRIRAMYRFVFQRPATEAEMASAEKLAQAFGLPALGRALLNANELIHLE